MESPVDITKLGALLKQKRGKRGLREVATEIGGISAATLSRVERGQVPDLGTYARICRWLDMSPGVFIQGGGGQESPQLSNEALVSAHLRADKTLDPKTVEAIVTMISLAYKAADSVPPG